MVVNQAFSDAEVDRLFRALADATRRDILRVAMTGDHSVSQLAQRYSISFAAVQKHVAVLSSVGLVSKQQRGREQLVTTEMATIRGVRELLEQFEQLWRYRMHRFGDVLADTRATPIEPAGNAGSDSTEREEP
ncbi:metalloregulator ArsR/SmtB family transcription factor [Nakamurella sp. A5-74]|uniref:Metalloregulator ArsR/SmtB family transcription factor n=1 Tax=Nakamurella sp. A5-74 TaxID=3158264 RepID=A0AAU8DPS0_9ACTN